MPDLLIPEVKALIGEEWPPVTFEVDRTSIRVWARAVGLRDPVFYDEKVAHARGFERLPAPPGFLGVPRWASGEPEHGPPIRGLHPELTRSLNGGTEFEYSSPVLAGDELVATTRIADVRQRTGLLGDMLIFSRETAYRRGPDVVAIMRATVINY